MSEQILKEILTRCATIGANQIESTNPNALAFTGLAHVVATMTRQPAVLEAFVNKVKSLQAEQDTIPCNDTGDSDGRDLGERDAASRDA